MAIKAILFDADGVIQQAGVSFPDALKAILDLPDEDADACIRDIFAAETPASIGKADFPTELKRVLTQWNRREKIERTLTVWTRIEVRLAMLDLVKTLRADGYFCGLATNQQVVRARYMSETLGYAAVFDQQFYSYALGHKKPEIAYFQALLAKIPFAPNEVLFIDDSENNVAAARETGIQAALFPTKPEEEPITMMRAIFTHYDIRLNT